MFLYYFTKLDGLLVVLHADNDTAAWKALEKADPGHWIDGYSHIEEVFDLRVKMQMPSGNEVLLVLKTAGLDSTTFLPVGVKIAGEIEIEGEKVDMLRDVTVQ